MTLEKSPAKGVQPAAYPQTPSEEEPVTPPPKRARPTQQAPDAPRKPLRRTLFPINENELD